MFDDDYLVKMLYKRNLLDDPMTTSEYQQIVNDYMIDTRSITNLLNKASRYKKNHPNFDHYSFITYGLIELGKERKGTRTRSK